MGTHRSFLVPGGRVALVSCALLLGLGLVFVTLMATAPAPAQVRADKGARREAGSGRSGVPEAVPTVVCSAPDSEDQDDMCIWVHPTDRSQSLVIAADKAADRIIAYDLEGQVRHTVPTPRPGNIDVRYGFSLGGKEADIVAFNQRSSGARIVVLAVDPEANQLRRVDNDSILTGKNYGGTLYRSRTSGRFYFFTTSKSGRIEQYELSDDGTGKVGGEMVRSWDVGFSEGAVADDETGTLYICQEQRGVWAVGAEPGDPVPGDLVIKVGQDGLKGDIEGLALYRRGDRGAYLVVSDQGTSTFKVFDLGDGFALAGTFAVQGAGRTDGIDVAALDLGPGFEKGLFACHSQREPCPVLLTPWERIAGLVGLPIETPRDPRRVP